MNILHCDCLNPELFMPYIDIFSINGLSYSCNIMGSILNIYCTTSQKFFVLYWLLEKIQLNTICVLLIYYWNHMIRNTLESPLIMLETRCLQAFTYSESPLLLKFSNLTCHDFHQIWFLPCRHPCMVSLDIPSMGHTLERSDCWLNFNIFQICFQPSLFGICC